MAKIKENTYQAVPPFLTLETSIRVKRSGGEEFVRITFQGILNPKRIPGKIITRDQALIKGMDADGDNIANGGKRFRLVSSVDVEGPAPSIKEATEPKIEKIPDAPVHEEKSDEDDPADEAPETSENPTIVGEVSNVQQAKEYLISTFGVSANQVKNKEFVLKVAAEKNVLFPAIQ